MEVKVKYKAFGLRGNRVSFTHTHECPDFKEIVKDCILFKGTTYTITVDEQVMEWLDELDKMFLIYKEDVDSIIDYSIVKPKERKNRVGKSKSVEVFKEHVEDLGMTDEMKINFFITYDRLKDSIKSMTTHQKVLVVFDALGLATEARTAAFQHMIDRYDRGSDETEDVGKLL